MTERDLPALGVAELQALLRRREVSISKHLRQAIDEMGPIPEMQESDVLAESR